jgi:hypothetical protein
MNGFTYCPECGNRFETPLPIPERCPDCTITILPAPEPPKTAWWRPPPPRPVRESAPK